MAEEIPIEGTSTNFVTTQPYTFSYTTSWSVVGACLKCGSPFLAQLSSVTVPEVHRSCPCSFRKRAPRKTKPEVETLDTPLPFPDENTALEETGTPL